MDPLRSQPLTPDGYGNADDRFRYQQTSRLPRLRNPNAPDHLSPFPPHPSVRVPANVRTGRPSAQRQPPAGVGTSPRPRAPPVRSPEPDLFEERTTEPRDFKFPRPPPMPSSQQTRRSPAQANTARRYNMHDSYVSSVGGDDTPKQTPKSGYWPTPNFGRESASIYPDDESIKPAYPSSKAIPQGEFFYPSSKHTTMKTVQSDSSHTPERTMPRINTTVVNAPFKQKGPDISPASSKTAAMNALGAAIAAGFSNEPSKSPAGRPRTPPSRTFSPVRMPFQDGDEASIRSHDDVKSPISPPELRSQTSKSNLLKGGSPLSEKSDTPVLGLGINQPGVNRGMSSRVPANKRPPRIDIDAVREMEARGSTSSLTELIRRATKLAANLDRGKTASRLGMLSMLGSQERLGQMAAGKRDSSMSDMISAFPAPGNTPRRDTMWPLTEKDETMVTERELRTKKGNSAQRQCCGMSLPVFILVMIALVITITAAVLVPVFLILIPRQEHSSDGKAALQALEACPANYKCNNGVGIVVDNACQCVCNDGFLGAHCDEPAGSGCAGADLSDGKSKYTNATVGESIKAVFSDADRQFLIPLNASTILSLFSRNDLSCQDENKLVNLTAVTTNFDANSGSSERRDYHPRFVVVPEILGPGPTFGPTPTLAPRQDAASLNGIVFQSTSSASVSNPFLVTLTTVNGAASTTTESSAPTASSVPLSADTAVEPLGSDPSKMQLQFAFSRVVILFVLQKSNTITLALNAAQILGQYFESGATNATVSVGFDDLQLIADMDAFTIKDGKGTVVGGK